MPQKKEKTVLIIGGGVAALAAKEIQIREGCPDQIEVYDPD